MILGGSPIALVITLGHFGIYIYVSHHFLYPFFLLCLLLQLPFPFGEYQNRKNLNILNVDPVFEQALTGRREQ